MSKEYESRQKKREERFKTAYQLYLSELNQAIEYVRTGSNSRTGEHFSEERIARKF